MVAMVTEVSDSCSFIVHCKCICDSPLLGWMDGWMTCDFMSFLTVFQSYQDDVWMIMKDCVQRKSVYS